MESKIVVYYQDKRTPWQGIKTPAFHPEIVLECAHCGHQTFYILKLDFRCSNCGRIIRDGS